MGSVGDSEMGSVGDGGLDSTFFPYPISLTPDSFAKNPQLCRDTLRASIVRLVMI